MRAIIQRVKEASVLVNNARIAAIGKGLLVLIGIEDADTQEDIEWLSGKIARLRIFDDPSGVMNCSVQEVNGDVLAISQFTLHASTKKGNRPSYLRAAKPETAKPMYERFLAQLEKDTGKKIYTGIFGAMMDVALVNDGPVTIVMDTKSRE